MNKHYLTNSYVLKLALDLRKKIIKIGNSMTTKTPRLYGVPRGGVPTVYSLMSGSVPLVIVDTPGEADIIVDDIVDSGKTRERYQKMYPSKPFLALIDKTDINSGYHGKWVVFPWESEDPDNPETLENNITRLIQFIGEDIEREGLKDTPKRFIKAWEHWTGGYSVNIAHLLRTSFRDGAEGYDELVMVKDIPFYSKCEHHLADIFGTVTVGYYPHHKIVGLSKINRVVDAFARRLQVQERMTEQIAESIQKYLAPNGVGVVIKARHMCMESRGVCHTGHVTITSSFYGCLKSDSEKRQEFLTFANMLANGG